MMKNKNVLKVQETDNMIKPYNMLTRQSETQIRPENNEKRKKTKTEAACS